MKQKTDFDKGTQRGIALPTVMIILLLAGLAALYTVQTSVKEQQVTADQARSDQAFATAQAGVDAALQRHNYFEDFITDGCGTTAPDADMNSDCTGFTDSEYGSFIAMFCDIWDEDDDGPTDDTDLDGHTSASMMKQFLEDKLFCTNRISSTAVDADGFYNDARVGILSVGKPDDDSGRRTISVISAPALPRGGEPPPLQPLVAKSTVDVTGDMRVINRYSNATVWSGKAMDTMGNMQTFINDGTLDPKSADRLDLVSIEKSLDPSVEFDNAMQGSGKSIGANSDVLDNDHNLDHLSEDEMFEGFFSGSKDKMKALSTVVTDIGDIDEGQTGFIWVDDPDLKGQIPSLGDCSVDPPKAVMLVVEVPEDGKLQFTGNSVICGMVFVYGDVASTVGGFTVSGAMIATGALDLGAGNARIVFDPLALAEPPEGYMGSRGVDTGSWKDWQN